MEFILFEDMVVSLEFLLFVLELAILLIILMHIREIKKHDKLVAEEVKDIKRLHHELHETLRLLKEDIRELSENQGEMHKTVKRFQETGI